MKQALQREKKKHSPWQLFDETIACFAIRDRILQHAGEIRGRVLDLGCGDRRYEEYLNGHQSWVGLDYPAHNDPRGRQADVHGDALSLPFTAQVFDTVLCTQVLEHVPEPQTLLGEAWRVLKPEGRLILTAPQYNCLHEEPRDFFRFTCYGLQHLARKAGFHVERIEPIGGFVSLFAFITTLHCAPLRIRIVKGLWQWLAWRLDRVLFRPKDCMGYLLIAVRPPVPHEGRRSSASA